MANTYDLQGKWAIVTGGARGVGRAVAELLLASGASVRIWDASPAQVPGTKADLVDITDQGSIDAAVSRLPDAEVPDILVNSAGYLGRTQAFVGHAGADWQRIVAVNLAGTYSAASAGVIAFTKALGRELADRQIFVNCVAPGPIDTEMIRGLGADAVDAMIADSPMKRLGLASEVAQLVAWLSSDASRFNTGAVFDMSGGRARY